MGHKIAFAIVSSAFIFAVVFAGCERLPSDDMSVNAASALTVTPSNQTINANTKHTIDISASGGNGDYAWSLENSSLGTLTPNGSTATYQNRTNAIGVNVVYVLDTSGLEGTCTITQE